MKILLSFTHVIPMLVIKQLTLAISNGYRQLWFKTFFKISSFVFNRTNKLMPVWNNTWVSK